MAIINIHGTTAKGLNFLKNYKNGITPFDGLYTIYARPSWQKLRAYENILKDFAKMDGVDLKICGYNTTAYTAAFKIKKYDIWQVVYYTAQNVYYIDVDDTTELLLELLDD